MTQTSPAKVKVTGISQVALVVNDLQAVVENYWNILGIGPWDIYAWETPLVYARTYHGKPAWAREKIALAQVGAVVLELCQPIDGDSVFQDFLMERGEGLHHLGFLVDDVDETVEILTKEGFPSLQGGHFGPTEYNGAYNYIDTKPLRAIWEVIHVPDSIGVEPTRYPETAHESQAKVKVKGINQVTLVVKDIQETMENYWNIFGIGPWNVYAWEAPLVYDYKYHGKPAWARVRLAMTQVGAVEFELIEHLDGDSIYRDFLMEHGEGVHHINFLVSDVDDVDETVKILEKEGFSSLQSARCGDNGAYHYIDVKPLRAIWEVIHVPDNKGVQATHYPED